MENSLIKNKDNKVTNVKKQKKTQTKKIQKFFDKISEDFVAPKINEYEKLNSFNYNVNS